MTTYTINQQINDITAEIGNKYPELLKYISEMPVAIPDHASPEITLTKLKDYYKSLTELQDHYSTTHKGDK